MAENKRGHNASPMGFVSVVADAPKPASRAKKASLKSNGTSTLEVEQQSSVELAGKQFALNEESKNKMASLLTPLQVRDDGTGFYYTQVSRGRRVPEEIEHLLYAKLLAYGGGTECVTPLNVEENCPELLDRGFFVPENTKVRLLKGRPSNCHGNSANLWKQGKGQIVSGYALSADGLWRQHSWVTNKNGIIETTVMRVKYYGYALNEDESKQFAYLNH